MLKNQVVLLTTICNTGTGILYPCKYEQKDRMEHANYYIVLTNRHVLKDIGDNELKEDIKNLLKLQLYDNLGGKIDEKDILGIRAFCPKWKYDKNEDVAALLVIIKDLITIDLEINVFQGTLTDRSILYTEGYPGVLLDDEINQKLQFQGVAKSTFPENKRIGIFQITDDYHWYNNLQDKDLLDGMSGSPVYVESQGNIMLLGMNQSVSVMGSGQNPFKLVYYLRMEYIFECLRDYGCIIYQKTSETAYQIQWIHGMESEINNYTNNPTFFLIGGSGAGKSSFAKDFSYHGNCLLSTNDGQTTRTAVVYEYSIFCDKPRVIVDFMNQDQFCKKMSELQGAFPAIRIIRKVFEISQDIEKDELTFMKNCYHLITSLQIKSSEMKQLIQDIETCMEMKETHKMIPSQILIRTYEQLIEQLGRHIPVQLVKCLCDRKRLIDIRQSYQESYEKQYLSKEESQKLVENIITHLLKDIVEDEPELITAFEVILRDYLNEKINFYEYQKQCAMYLKENNVVLRYGNNFPQFRKKISSILNDIKSEYIEELLYVEGFFNIKEFGFLKTLNDKKENWWKILECQLFSNSPEEDLSESHTINIWKLTQSIYKQVHSQIKNAVEEEYGIKENRFEKLFSLPKINEQEKNQLRLCLQVYEGYSLTGIIHSVKVEDMVANNYAMLFLELKINKLRMIDTYGLDHIQGTASMESALYHHIYFASENLRIEFKDINVLYIKKLDSGKPDELRIILPCVRTVIPQAPIYCIFTGIDIFYKKPDELGAICWKNGNYEKTPKAIRYILSERGRKDLMGDKDEISKKNMYLVLKNNLIPYCGNNDLVQREYAFYKNNVTYIRKLMASIIMKEYSSLQIVDINIFKEKSENIKKDIQIFILDIFKKASVHTEGIHWKTIQANVKNICNNKRLGKSTLFRYQWNQRFHEAYAFVVGHQGMKIAQKFHISEEAIDAALRNVEESYLGTGDNLSKIDMIDNKSNFRIYLEEMYNSSSYKYNPFAITNQQEKEIILDKKLRKEFFKDVFDFAKGIKDNQELMNKFVDDFMDKLEIQIKNDNTDKIQNIIYLDPQFSKIIHRMRLDFTEKYIWDEKDKESATISFKDMLMACISNGKLF